MPLPITQYIYIQYIIYISIFAFSKAERRQIPSVRINNYTSRGSYVYPPRCTILIPGINTSIHLYTFIYKLTIKLHITRRKVGS
jgi:hypothetical protein